MLEAKKDQFVDKSKKDQFIEKLINVNRVTKVVKGGRIMSFTVLMIVGDGDGSIGMGKAKSKEVPLAAQKAAKEARKNMFKVAITKGTIHHTVIAKHGATTVFLQSAKEGTGIIAGGAMRAIFEALGIKNITAKVHGSSNCYNVVRATFKALQNMYTPMEIAAKRGLSIQQILGA